MARIISIVNQKGGTGKSACTANLAVGLAQKNMKVLIVDADPQSDVSAGFGYRDCDDSNETLTVLMDAVMKDEDIPSDCYIRHQAEGIDIICSNIGLAGTEVQLVNAMSREYVLKQILYGIKDQYDAVIIDCMPSLGMITINALAASDEVLIPVEASYLPIKGLQQLLKTIGKVRKQINPKLQVGGILFTMVDAHTNDARNNMELLRNAYGSQIHIFDNYIPFSVRMKEAVREGQSIFSYDPKSKATEAYRRVTEEVLEDAIKKRATPVSLQPLDALFGTNEESINGISEIAIGSLHPFPNHPFQVRDDKKMEELSESIIQYGVLVPGIVRLRESGGYELVAGHRRKRACELAGLEKMPVIIKDLTDDESTVIMVDSNIQREELLISEKAFAYKMKYEALKRQGKRSDLTSCQLGKKLAAEEVSQNTEDSSRQILRYIHLTLLLPELLEMADDKKLPFNTAVEISYLRNEEQQVLLQYMSNHNMVPSMKQAKELKQISKERMLTYSEIDQICMNESTEKVQVQIPAKKLKQYFPETYTKTQMEEIIFMLLASWAEREGEE